MLCVWAAGHGAQSVIAALGTHKRRAAHTVDERLLRDEGVHATELDKLQKIQMLGRKIQSIEAVISKRRELARQVQLRYNRNELTSTQLTLRLESLHARVKGIGNQVVPDDLAGRLAAVAGELKQRADIEDSLAQSYKPGSQWGHLSTVALQYELVVMRDEIAWMRGRLDEFAMDDVIASELAVLAEQFQRGELLRADYDRKEADLEELRREVAYLELTGTYWQTLTRPLEPANFVRKPPALPEKPRFIPATRFDGVKDGYVYARREHGLGYYADATLDAVIEEENSHTWRARLAKLNTREWWLELFLRLGEHAKTLKHRNGWAQAAAAAKHGTERLHAHGHGKLKTARQRTYLALDWEAAAEKEAEKACCTPAVEFGSILLALLLIVLFILPTICLNRSSAYSVSALPMTCCQDGACYLDPPCFEHPNCEYFESVVDKDVFLTSCDKIASELMEGSPEELLGEICPCTCAERQANPPPIFAQLLAPEGIEFSTDNTLIMEFGPCTAGTPRLDLSIYQSDYDDVSEWGGFSSQEYVDVYLNGEKVSKCNPSGKDCSLFQCFAGMDVTNYIVNNTLEVRIVNSQDVNANPCDGAGGVGDYWLAADLKLTGCLREVVYEGAERGDSICYDCKGIGLGPNRLDECGVCDDIPFNDCVEDCFGVWGGPSVVDGCGVCNGTDVCADCAGVAFGRKREDHCGDCDANPADDCVSDCSGSWGGDLVRDSCNVCGGDSVACTRNSSELSGQYTFYGVSEPPQLLEGVNFAFAQHYNGVTRAAADLNVEIQNYSMAIEGLIQLPFNPTAAMVTADSVVQLQTTLSVLLDLDASVIQVFDAVDFENQVCDFRYVVTMGSDISARFNTQVFKTQMARNARRAILLGNPQMAMESNVNIDEGEIVIPDVQVASIFTVVVTVRAFDTGVNSTMLSLMTDTSLIAAGMNVANADVTGGTLAVSSLRLMDFDCAGRVSRLPSPWLDAPFLAFLGDDVGTKQATGRWPATYDACGVCGGDGSTCVDCNGIAFGPSSLDQCGVCDTNALNDCILDCAGVWGGDATYDACGVCNGNDACMDCAFSAGGHSYVDHCMVCDDNWQNDCVPSKCAALRDLPYYPTYDDCSLTSSWGYSYDFTKYGGLHTIYDGDGSQLSFDMCGTVPVDVLPLQYRETCYVPPPPPPAPEPEPGEPEPEPEGPFGPNAPVIQVPDIADRVYVSGFDCPDWVANPFGSPTQWFSRSNDINGRPHWISDSGRFHIYYLDTTKQWYLDNDLTIVAPDDFTQGFWGFVPAAALVLYPDESIPDDVEEGALQPNPIGVFTEWREYCRSEYVRRTVNMDPGCNAAIGNWFSTERVSLYDAPMGPAGPPPPLYFPEPCIIHPESPGNASNATAVNDTGPVSIQVHPRCGFVSGTLVAEGEIHEIVLYLKEEGISREQFEDEVKDTIATQLSLAGGYVHANDVILVSIQPGSVVIEYNAAVQADRYNQTMLAAASIGRDLTSGSKAVHVGPFSLASMSNLTIVETPNLISSEGAQEEDWSDVEVPCLDDPVGWHPVGLAYTCEIFAAEQFCDEHGQAGPGWLSAFGDIAEYTDENGINAGVACCGCGGGYAGPEPEPEPEPEPPPCFDDMWPGGLWRTSGEVPGPLEEMGLTCEEAKVAAGGVCWGGPGHPTVEAPFFVERPASIDGKNLTSVCPITCNYGCAYVMTSEEILAANMAALGLGRRRTQSQAQSVALPPSPPPPPPAPAPGPWSQAPSEVARSMRPQRYGEFFSAVVEIETATELHLSEMDRRQSMLGGEDFKGHIVQIVHLPNHPEEYRKEGQGANPAGWGGVPMTPIVFNLSCGEDADPQEYYRTNVTIVHAYANGSISFNTPAVVIPWQMRGACPTVSMLQEHDYSTRATLDTILDALWLHAIAERLCCLILVGWLIVIIMRHTRLTSPSARELFPFRKTELIPGVLNKEDILVTFQRESNTLYLLFCLDVLCLVLLYLLGAGALGWLGVACGEATLSCSTDGHDPGELWADARQLCYTSAVLHILGWGSIVGWLKFRNAANADRSTRHTEWSQSERLTVAAAKASGGSAAAVAAGLPLAGVAEEGGEGGGGITDLARRGSMMSYSSYGSHTAGGGNAAASARYVVPTGRGIRPSSAATSGQSLPYSDYSYGGSFASRNSGP
jgi:hypothetical protein